MGIFIEDLLNFGNLIDSEFEVEILPEHLRKVFPSWEFVAGDGILKIRGKKRVLFLSKGFEFRGGEDPERVYTEREDELRDLGIYLKILSPEGLEELTKDERLKREGEHLRLSLYEAFRQTETYSRIPRQFRDRINLTRYRLKNGKISLYMTVVK